MRAENKQLFWLAVLGGSVYWLARRLSASGAHIFSSSSATTGEEAKPGISPMQLYQTEPAPVIPTTVFNVAPLPAAPTGDYKALADVYAGQITSSNVSKYVGLQV